MVLIDGDTHVSVCVFNGPALPDSCLLLFDSRVPTDPA